MTILSNNFLSMLAEAFVIEGALTVTVPAEQAALNTYAQPGYGRNPDHAVGEAFHVVTISVKRFHSYNVGASVQ